MNCFLWERTVYRQLSVFLNHVQLIEFTTGGRQSRCKNGDQDSQPLRLTRCSVSRTLQCALFSIYPNSPMWPPSSVTSTGFLSQSASDSRRWCWPSRLSAELHPSTSKHWSDHMPQSEHFALLHQPAGTPITESKQSLLTKVATLCFGTSVVEWTPDQCQNSRVTLHLLHKTQDSFVQISPWPRITWPTQCSEEGLKITYFIHSGTLWFLSCDKGTNCRSLWTKISAQCPKCECKCDQYAIFFLLLLCH